MAAAKDGRIDTTTGMSSRNPKSWRIKIRFLLKKEEQSFP